MNQIADFLRARYAERRAIAEVAANLQCDPENGWGITDTSNYAPTEKRRWISPHIGMLHEAESAEHIVANNPAVVIADLNAKLAIVNLMDETLRCAEGDTEVDFDARLFTLADPVEVANYYIWRQRDAVRNSISMAAQAQFSHRQLHGVSTGGMQELLWAEHSINWNDYPDGCKRGRVAQRRTGEKPVEYVDKRTQETVKTVAVRSWWESSAAPHFTTEPRRLARRGDSVSSDSGGPAS